MDTTDATLITLCWELHKEGVSKSRIAQRLGKHRGAIHLWMKGMQESGLLTFLDGGPEFKAELSDNGVLFYQRHRVARPYRKDEQSFIESFNRTVRKECLGWEKYRVTELQVCQGMAEAFLQRYHYYRPHMGLGMAPPLPRRETDCRIFAEN